MNAPDVDQAIPPKNEQMPEYRAENVSSLEEEYLASHCLFQDIKSIGSVIHRVWQHFRGGLSILAFSIAVNSALCFVRDLENFCETIQQRPIMRVL